MLLAGHCGAGIVMCEIAKRCFITKVYRTENIMADKAIFITGAASGIGLATARLFAAKGWRVGCFDVNEQALKELSADLGESALCRPLDVTHRPAVVEMMRTFETWTGNRLDLLFSNAGIDAKGPFADMAWERIMSVLQVNLIGTLAVVHAGLPHLRATPNSLCLMTASASAIFGAPGMAAYSASKAAVRGFTEALAVELAADGVRAADLLPGIVDTGMLPANLKAMLPTEGMWRAISAGSVAEAAWAAYHGNRLHWYVPEQLLDYDAEVTATPEAVRDRRIAGSPF
jgi:NAD(P)-dependent dehydrogenase (short-subunit alcohol dehydrogenase family)